jgi:hypothetical protein
MMTICPVYVNDVVSEQPSFGAKKKEKVPGLPSKH